ALPVRELDRAAGGQAGAAGPPAPAGAGRVPRRVAGRSGHRARAAAHAHAGDPAPRAAARERTGARRTAKAGGVGPAARLARAPATGLARIRPGRAGGERRRRWRGAGGWARGGGPAGRARALGRGERRRLPRQRRPPTSTELTAQLIRL